MHESSTGHLSGSLYPVSNGEFNPNAVLYSIRGCFETQNQRESLSGGGLTLIVTRGRDVKFPERFQSSKHCFSWVVFGGVYLCDYLLDSPKIGTYLILFCLTQMKIMFKNFRETVCGV